VTALPTMSATAAAAVPPIPTNSTLCHNWPCHRTDCWFTHEEGQWEPAPTPNVTDYDFDADDESEQLKLTQLKDLETIVDVLGVLMLMSPEEMKEEDQQMAFTIYNTITYYTDSSYEEVVSIAGNIYGDYSMEKWRFCEVKGFYYADEEAEAAAAEKAASMAQLDAAIAASEELDC